MSRRLARAGRLGQRSTGQGRPWSPASIPGLEGWWSADNALASVGPDVTARPGNRVRSVRDSSKHRRDMEQTTANRQPRLGYLRPPKGNLLRYSGDPTNSSAWSTDGGTAEVYGETDPDGNPAILVTVPVGVVPTNGNRKQVAVDAIEAGRSYRVQVWVKLIQGGDIRICVGGACITRTPSVGEWELIDQVVTTGNNKIFIIGVGPVSDPRQFALGRTHLTPVEWSDEYVATEDEPIIPDTSELQRALVFDGVVGNQLETSETLGNAPDVTVVAVHGLQQTVSSGYPLSGRDRITNTNAVLIRPFGSRQLTRWGSYGVESPPIEPRRAYLDTIYQQPDGTVVFRNSGREYGSYGNSPVETYPPNNYSIGLEDFSRPNTFANGPITDVLYFTRALSESEIQRLEDYFLVKSGINRIVTEESDVKEWETVKALAPGIWYLDGEAINVEPVRQIVVPAGSAGQELTVGDSYGIEVLP